MGEPTNIETDYARAEPRRVLEEALEDLPDDAIACIVVVETKSGSQLRSFGALQGKDLLWALERAKQALLED